MPDNILDDVTEEAWRSFLQHAADDLDIPELDPDETGPCEDSTNPVLDPPPAAVLEGEASSQPTSKDPRTDSIIETPKPAPQPKVTFAHGFLGWPVVVEALSNCGRRTHDALDAFKFNEIAWLKHLETPAWNGPIHSAVGSAVIAILPREPSKWLEVPLSRTKMLTSSYFNTFGLLYPLLDRDDFTRVTFPMTLKSPGDATENTILTLLVMALGELAHEVAPTSQGTVGEPADHLLGHFLFDKARQRIGLASTSYTLGSVQIFCLIALYYGQCGRYMEMWHAGTTAAHNCLILLSQGPIDYSVKEGQQIALAYWNCMIIETISHWELGLPKTDLDRFESTIPMPNFIGAENPVDRLCEQLCKFRLRFFVYVSLIRFYRTVRNILSEEDWEAEVPHRLGIGQPVIYSDISAVVEGWPNCVPDGLKWTMDLPLTSIPAQGRFTVQTSSTIPLGALVRPLLYGRLRMLHTHVQYCIYRPYLYKVLHFPEQASSEDIEKSLLCLKASVAVPMYLHAAKDIKRMVPYPFVWTQTVLGIVLLFQMASCNPLLKDWKEKCHAPADIEVVTQAILEWIHGMREGDGITKWASDVLREMELAQEICQG